MKKNLGILLTVVGCMMTIAALILKIKGQMSVSVIGGADGPTSVFIAGKVGSSQAIAGIIVGIVVLVVGILIVVKKK